jgi:hypothetical protein
MSINRKTHSLWVKSIRIPGAEHGVKLIGCVCRRDIAERVGIDLIHEHDLASAVGKLITPLDDAKGINPQVPNAKASDNVDCVLIQLWQEREGESIEQLGVVVGR